MTGEQTTGLPLLLEIGTEEIPARFLPPAIAELKKIASSVLGEYRVSFGEIRTFATPRRLALLADGVAAMQDDVVKEVFGPSRKAAFNEQGAPTKAAEGFASSLGIPVSKLVVKTKGKGEYMAALIEEKGVETRAVMPEILKKIVLVLRFPKAMRWGDGTLTFARPIHWFTAVFGTDTVLFETDGIKSSNTTRGHRFLSPGAFQVRDVGAYASLLENNCVILDQERRRKIIADGITALASESGGVPLMDEDLLDLVNYLVEYPMPVLCSFDAEYLKLPKELLTTVMKDHQKYFAVLDSAGSLTSRFVVISNTRADNAATVRVGAERVIRARFDDARFYFHEDRKKPLAERVDDLGKVTFHDELGSLRMKADRIEAMASFLASRVQPDLAPRAARAARLAKTDLLTGVVREFPELQGVMGRYYAGLDGEDREVSEAIEEQYLPKSLGGTLPATGTGAILSLADKIDNVASFFSIGLVPTGSEDPFALRRQAMGIISILLDKGYAVTLGEIFAQALASVADEAKRKSVMETVNSFMQQRIEFILSSMGYDQDLVKAVLPLAFRKPLATIVGRIDALREFKSHPSYAAFLTGIKRVRNIIPGVELPPVRDELLTVDEEKLLASAARPMRESVSRLLQEYRFAEALAALADMTPSINSFFDKVLVMDKDEAVKMNRLALLRDLWDAASGVADFSRLA